MEYIIVKGWPEEILEKRVNEMIKKGYKPQGGTSINQNGYLIQAMIKEE